MRTLLSIYLLTYLLTYFTSNKWIFVIHNCTALHFASKSGHMNLLTMLVNAGGDIEAKTKIGSTPLIEASLGGQLSIVQLLLSKGAQVNNKQTDG